VLFIARLKGGGGGAGDAGRRPAAARLTRAGEGKGGARGWGKAR
jgi:hypothetical protein